MRTITESLETPIREYYDVIVCGGGLAGVAAAVSAARQGSTVLLIEKSIQLGGLATIGLISWYEPLCDGRGRRIMNGMTYELLQLCMRYGFHTLDDCWKDGAVKADTKERVCTFFSHSLMTLALDTFVLDAGVNVLLDTSVVETCISDHRVEGVFVENKDGRSLYQCGAVIDCTGDADVAVRSGLDYEDGESYLTYIAYQTDIATCAIAEESGNIMDSRNWCSFGSDMEGHGHPEGLPYYKGISGADVTDFVLRGRKMLFDQIVQQKPFSRDITVLPSIPQYRKTRRILGNKTLCEEDAGKHTRTSIAALPDFPKRGVIYEIPYETLFNEQMENLFVAGRCISSTGWAWDVTRVIPGVTATGQASGVAAALCCQEHIPNHGLCIEKLQDALKNQGVWLHF